jgi:hypothetical protein
MVLSIKMPIVRLTWQGYMSWGMAAKLTRAKRFRFIWMR